MAWYPRPETVPVQREIGDLFPKVDTYCVILHGGGRSGALYPAFHSLSFVSGKIGFFFLRGQQER